jgi:membrane fusion protein, copper/silver efflux system
MTRQTRRLIIAIAGALLVIAAATTAVAFRDSLAHLPGLTWLQSEAPAEVWVCPMHPDVRSPHPGRCPQCGMALVKEDPEEAGGAHAGAHAGQAQAASPAAPDVSAPPPDTVGDARAAVTLDGRRQQLMGVRTVPVARRTLAARARATGLVTADETRQTEVTLKVEGWIEQLHVDYTGRAVTRGEPLFALYSPDLIAAQQEYVLARQAREQAATSQVPESRDIADRLVSAARERLQLWDLPASAIETLERTGTPARTIVFPSPVTGVVIEKHAVQGMRVMAGQPLFRIVDLSRVWVEADVYEGELGLLTRGTTAALRIDAFPGESFTARLTFVSPVVDQITRTVRARFELPNPAGRLRPGMFAAVDVSGPARDVLTIPTDALVDTGRRQIVFISEGDGYYVPRDVRVGMRLDGHVEILEGLEEGQQVASAALFFLDSESQLRAALEGYAPSLGEAAGAAAPIAGLQIDLTTEPTPPRAGNTAFVVSVRDESGEPIADAEVTVTLYMPPMPSMNMPAMRSEGALSNAGAGRYRGIVDVLMAGRWDVTVTVTRDGARIGTRQLTIVAR